jgi:hypothetical protein
MLGIQTIAEICPASILNKITNSINGPKLRNPTVIDNETKQSKNISNVMQSG